MRSNFIMSYTEEWLPHLILLAIISVFTALITIPSSMTTVTMAPGETVVIRIPELSDGESFPVRTQDGIVYGEVQDVPDSYTPLFRQGYFYRVDNFGSDTQRFHRLLYPGSVVGVRYNFSQSVILQVSERAFGSDLTELGELKTIYVSTQLENGMYELEVVEAGEYSFEFINVEENQGDVTFDLSLTSIEGEYDLTGYREFRSGGRYLIFRNNDRDSFLDFSYGSDQPPNLLARIALFVGAISGLVILILYLIEVYRVVRHRINPDMELCEIKGVGHTTAKRFANLGVRRVRDLRGLDESELYKIRMNRKIRGMLIQQIYFGEAPAYVEGWTQLFKRIRHTLRIGSKES